MSENLHTAADPGPVSAVLERRRAAIDAGLRRRMTEHLEASRAYGPAGEEMAALLREFVTAGGKRIRGALALEGYRAIRGDPVPGTIIHAALALELLQAFLLVHDDVIDQDELRRGQMTFHRRYRTLLEARGHRAEAPRLGDAMAMMAGDILCALANDELARVEVDSRDLSAAQRLFSQIILDTGYGEVLDVLGGLDAEQTHDGVLRMYELKTARYSFEGPLVLGATLGGGSPEQLRGLSAYGIPLGIAFQLRDDIIGIFGTEEEVGKPIGSDLKEGKRTPLVLHALAHGSAEQRRLVRAALGNRALTADDVEHVAGALRTSGALGAVDSLAASYTAEARRALAEAPLQPVSLAFLDALAVSLSGRRA